ncbi:MAG TPA: PepSY domain-containing protein [Candidatus Polarisedimenticolaceae bacterium]|nr:PepSY domain-containing protein [Candidatus Polarisedimenticolaceae bacterium]
MTNTVQLRKRAAVEAAAAVGSPNSSYEVAAKLAIEPAVGPDRLVYVVRLDRSGDDLQSWEVLVDATTGQAGTPTDLVQHLTGRVKVYAEDPSSPVTFVLNE